MRARIRAPDGFEDHPHVILHTAWRYGTPVADAYSRKTGGAMSESQDIAEQTEHAAGHDKKIALLISVLALFLAFSETLGKSSQTVALSDNVQASDLWNFFQAKTIRQTVLRTAAEALALNGPSNDAAKAATAKKIDEWQKLMER
jgi:hypothetical protein